MAPFPDALNPTLNRSKIGLTLKRFNPENYQAHSFSLRRSSCTARPQQPVDGAGIQYARMFEIYNDVRGKR